MKRLFALMLVALPASCFAPGPDPSAGANPQLHGVFGAREIGTVASVAFDGDTFWFVDQPYGSNGQGPPEVRSASKHGGGAKIIDGASPWTSTAIIAVDATRVYWAERGSDDVCHLYAFAKSGGATTEIGHIDERAPQNPGSLLIDGTTAWLAVSPNWGPPWIHDGKQGAPTGGTFMGAIDRIDLSAASSSSTRIATPQFAANGAKNLLAQDASSLFFAEQINGTSGPSRAVVTRLSKSDGRVLRRFELPPSSGTGSGGMVPLGQVVVDGDDLWVAVPIDPGGTSLQSAGVLHGSLSDPSPTPTLTFAVTTKSPHAISDVAAKSGDVVAMRTAIISSCGGNGCGGSSSNYADGLLHVNKTGAGTPLDLPPPIDASSTFNRLETDGSIVYLVGTLGIVGIDRSAIP